MLPINIKTYYTDITQANVDGEPTWEVLDDYKETYGVKDLSPASMKDLADRIAADSDLAHTWLDNENRRGRDHDDWETTELYCKLVSSEMHELNACKNNDMAQVTNMLGDNFKKKSLNYWMDYLVGDWIQYGLRDDEE